MADLPARRSPSPLTRALTYVRALLPSVARQPPKPPGISVGRVTSNRRASAELEHLGTSPTVHAAVHRRALSIARFPLRVYRGLDPMTAEPVDLKRGGAGWARSLLRLLDRPDPEDIDALFPANPGIIVWAQVIADLVLTGDAYVVPTGSGMSVAGLSRQHPAGAVLERTSAGEFWRFGGDRRLYPRRSIAHIRLLSAAAGGAGELGIGAAAALRSLLSAEQTALEQTAEKIAQGGVDIIVTGKTAQTQAFLKNKANRDQIVAQVTESLGGGGMGRRVYVLSGELEIKDAGFRPVDLQAPELLESTEKKVLQALGVVPIALGAEASTFATAVQQYRAQADMDAALAALLEAGLFRPLARQFALAAGGQWAGRADEVTCRYDLSTHPGNIYARSESINRASKLIDMGWSGEQVAAAEGLDLPPPEGTPKPGSQPAAPGAPQPAQPLGDDEPGGEEPGAGDDRARVVELLRDYGARGYQVSVR